MESKALVKSTNINVACRFFARTPSRIFRMVNICEVVDLFLRKLYIYIYIYIYMFKVTVKLVTTVEGDSEALFSVATTPCCREGCYSFLWFSPLYS